MKPIIRPGASGRAATAAARTAGASGTRPAKARAAGPRLPQASREAKRVAAAVLEVLAGCISPAAAATALGTSVPRYYLLEQRALEGFVAASEPRAGGRGPSTQREVDTLRKQIDRLERECTRYQSLLRAAQRTIGLVPPAPPSTKASSSSKTKRKRRPTARALVAAQALRADLDGSTDRRPNTGDSGDEPAPAAPVPANPSGPVESTAPTQERATESVAGQQNVSGETHCEISNS
jgi:hypothetical protein